MPVATTGPTTAAFAVQVPSRLRIGHRVDATRTMIQNTATEFAVQLDLQEHANRCPGSPYFFNGTFSGEKGGVQQAVDSVTLLGEFLHKEALATPTSGRRR